MLSRRLIHLFCSCREELHFVALRLAFLRGIALLGLLDRGLFSLEL